MKRLDDNQQLKDIQQEILNSKVIQCPKCNSEVFLQVFKLKKINAMISPTGKDEVLPIPVYVCSSCGEEYIPTDLNDISNE